MDKNQIPQILGQCQSLLENGASEDEYSKALSLLGSIVQATGLDMAFRQQIAQEAGILDQCIDIISNSLLVDFSSSREEELYVRLLRGLNLFTRNIVASSPTVVDLPLLLLNIQHFLSKVDQTNPFFLRCFVSYLEILANLVLQHGADFKCNLALVSDTFKPAVLDIISCNDSCMVPFLISCKGFVQKENVAALLKEELHQPLLSFLLQRAFTFLNVEEVDLSADAVLGIFENIFSNESCEKWLLSMQEHEDFGRILKLSQLVTTHREDWDNYQCLAIMGWAFTFLKIWAESASVLLLASEYDKDALSNVHSKLVVVLDIMADLGKFHSAKQFLEHYNVLDTLVPLLRATHENTKARTMKDKASLDGKKFPMVKSLIIEIMAFACHKSFKSQEKIRELHGLEVVLSSCIIDEDNPYIKERSILCLKFLLENNKANQDFVAQLEAKEVVDDTALHQAGYEVEMSDGKVKLRKLAETNESNGEK